MEEFTGPVCGSCPFGHKKSFQITSLDPDHTFDMRIIDEGFSFSSFDLSLSVGDTLEKNAKVTGFPQITVNRKIQNGDAMAIYVDDWKEAVENEKLEDAYVNIAAAGTVNMETRELTVEVKAYFTGNGTPNNKINIALLQSHIAGMQFGNDDNHSAILPNGEYEHNHILRHLITGQWGEDISSTSQGTLYHNTFTYNLPHQIQSIPLIMEDIEIIAFIAEGKNEIINVTKAQIDYILPSDYQSVEIALSSSNNTTNLCENSYQPSVTVYNLGNTAIHQFKIKYSINKDVFTFVDLGSEEFNITILPGNSTTLNFNQIPISHSINLMGYEIELLDSNIIDLNSGNNWFTEKIYTLNDMPTLAHYEDFDDYTAYWCPLNAIVKDEFPLFIGVTNYYTGTSYEMGAYGNSVRSLLFDNYNTPQGTQASIQFDKIDFSIQQLYGLTFSYAYAQKNTESNDKILFEVTTDCGETWETVNEQSGADLTTTSDFKTDEYVPALNEWLTKTIDLSNYAGQNNVSIKITGISDHGNALYLDDVHFGADPSVGVDYHESQLISLYPNPSSQFLTINLNQSDYYSITLTNSLGQNVFSKKKLYGKTFQLNLDEIENGLYFVLIKSQNNEITTKFIKE